MPETLDVAVHRGFGELLFRMPFLPVLPDEALRDPADFEVAEIRQEHLEPLPVPGLGIRFAKESAREVGKAHGGLEVGELRTPQPHFLLVLLVDSSRRAAVA